MHVIVAGREQRCLPRLQPFGGDWRVGISRGVQVHFHHTVDVAIRARALPLFNAQASSKRRAHGVEIQRLAFYGGGLQNIRRECGQGGAVPVGIGER